MIILFLGVNAQGIIFLLFRLFIPSRVLADVELFIGILC